MTCCRCKAGKQEEKNEPQEEAAWGPAGKGSSETVNRNCGNFTQTDEKVRYRKLRLEQITTDKRRTQERLGVCLERFN